MKTYKTWEMIKEIIENPKKKYRPVNDDNGYVEFENNQLVWNGRGQRGQVMIVTETDENEWEEVKESQRRDNMFEGGRMNNISDLADHLVEHAEYAFEHKDREELERVLKEYFYNTNNGWTPFKTKYDKELKMDWSVEE